ADYRARVGQRYPREDGVEVEAGDTEPRFERNPSPVLERRACPHRIELETNVHPRRGSGTNHFLVPGGLEVVSRADELRNRIREMVGEYYREAFPAREFVPGTSQVPVSGRVFDEQELELLVESSLDFWLTTGRFADQFEREFAKFAGVREAIL